MSVVSCSSLVFRRPVADDHARVMATAAGWWGGREPSATVPAVFFEHFRSSSLLVEHEDLLVAFLVGFDCPDHADEAWVHYCAVHPAWRRAGLGRDVYRRFCAGARARGRSVVRAVAAADDTLAIAFHLGLGFTAVSGDGDAALPVAYRAPHPRREDAVRLELRLSAMEAA